MQHAVVVENYVRKAVALSVTTTMADSLSQNPELHFMEKWTSAKTMAKLLNYISTWELIYEY